LGLGADAAFVGFLLGTEGIVTKAAQGMLQRLSTVGASGAGAVGEVNLAGGALAQGRSHLIVTVGVEKQVWLPVVADNLGGGDRLKAHDAIHPSEVVGMAMGTTLGVGTHGPSTFDTFQGYSVNHMANAEHLRRLEQGVEGWNQWRRGQGDRPLDLHGANLQGYHLNGIDLQGANLRAANLNGTSLVGANLQGANLVCASFLQACLMQANLADANLMRSRLVLTNLTKAYCAGANFSGAIVLGCYLMWANLSETQWIRTCLNGSHLRGANLKQANLGSAIAHRINLRDAYLMGANLTDWSLRHSVCDRATWIDGTTLDHTPPQPATMPQPQGATTRLHWIMRRHNYPSCPLS
jgi:uncharacterized protein YjbI with pentapeptide repeats